MPYKDLVKRKEYDRIWQVARQRANRAKALEMLGGKCVRCGIDDARVLQIDHIIPILRRTNGIDSGGDLARDVATGKIDLVLLQLLCANCHAIKTYHE